MSTALGLQALIAEGVQVAAITAVSTVLVALLGLLGLRWTRNASNTANADVTTPAEQQSAAEALAAAAVGLVEPYQRAVADLGLRVTAAEQRAADADAKAEQAMVESTRLLREVARWREIAKSLARAVVKLRAEVVELGGTPDPEPEEVAVLRVMSNDDTLGVPEPHGRHEAEPDVP